MEGFLNLKPNHFSLKLLKDEHYLEILSGESLDLSFGRNLAPTTPSFETLFSINARNFAAFESPTGNYNFFGEVKTDLSSHKKCFRSNGSQRSIGQLLSIMESSCL